VVHRDIKPENVVVGPDNRLKILDFGIAKDLEDGKTKTGTGMGTVDYMAPEQYTDASKVDQRADIYALGMTLYEMLAGRLPWPPSTTEFKVLTIKSRGILPPATDFYPEIPPRALAAIDGALAVDLKKRFADVAAFRCALDPSATHSTSTSSATPPKSKGPPNKHCTQCGTFRMPGTDFCTGCGSNYLEAASGIANCRRCNARLGADVAFCTKCGTQAARTGGCKHCQAPIEPGTHFCTRCGKPR